MLKLQHLRSPADSKKYFDTLNLEHTTWVVSGLDSKLKLREDLLKTRPVIADDTVLRVHELWKTILRRIHPKLRFISRDTALAFVSKKLEKFPDHLNKPGTPDLVLNYISYLMPILSHNTGLEAMRDYFSKNRTSKTKWGQWYALSQDIFSDFTNEHCVLLDWASGLLVNQGNLNRAWKRNLFFDLSANLTSLESELILTLSKFVDITVLVPSPPWEEKSALTAYKILDPDLFQKYEPAGPKNAQDYLKLSTQLGEVKAAVTTVRGWLDSGLKTSEVAIVAPDIGIYWTALSEFLNDEGIPTQRPVRAPIKTFSNIQSWLSKMKLNLARQSQILSSDLETSLYFQGTKEPLLPFDYFKQTFSRVYDWTDLKRDRIVWNHFASAETSQIEITKDEFARWCSQLWEGPDTVVLQTLLSAFYQEALDTTRLRARQWFDILDSIAGRKEVEVLPGCKDGLECLDISSAKEVSAKKVFVLGMSENQLRTQFAVHLDEQDIFNLKAQYGFILPQLENVNLEFEAKWLLENSATEYTLSYAQSDFDGNALAPSINWLRGAVSKYGNIQLPFANFKDRKSELYLNTEALKSERKWTNHQFVNMEKRILQDMGIKEFEKIQFFPRRVSPSSIEDYLKCPFVFSAKKILHLTDQPEIDLDIDYMTSGRLLHEILNIVVKEPFSSSYSDEQLFEIIDQARSSIGFKIGEEQLWGSYRKRYLQFVRQFIEFEYDWRKKFPKTNTKFKEAVLNGYLNLDTGELSSKALPNSVEFKGKLDRLDLNDKNQVVLIDYKLSTQSLSNYKSWVSNHELQLALYAMAIEKGLLGSDFYEVVGAVYFSIKDLDRNKGFVLDGDFGLFEINSRRKNYGSDKEKMDLFKNIEAVTKQVLSDMSAGTYDSKPTDVKECENCKWSKMCRAPHLN